ncbi:MAG: DUF3795 domain-containing protein [Anaerolineales bacterium]|nr:DUF3795 domain-containing protein [Anaerolineales bacterium]
MECIPPCGMYCGVCSIYLASRMNDLKTLGRLAKLYSRLMPGMVSVSGQDIYCNGCRSGRISAFCQFCAIRECAREKKLTGCHQCDDFPCDTIDSFPIPAGKKIILRAIPSWRMYGTEEFIRIETARYVCPACGQQLYRGATRCSTCKSPVELDK